MDNFAKALDFTLKWEGGYSDHPNDPGGATNKGITLRTAKAFGVDEDGDGDTDKEDIRILSLEEAARIYKAGYWDVCNCDSFDLGFAIALFDTAVNCGPSRAKKWAEESITLYGNFDTRFFLEKRSQHYLSLAKQARFKPFLKGWMNRLNDLKKYLEIIENE